MEKLDYRILKQLRESRKITQERMSRELNTTQSKYSKLDNGLRKIDNLEVIQKIAKLFGMQSEKLRSILAGNERKERVHLI
jgi:transcriptional regulator with XRE-family HTH domain